MMNFENLSKYAFEGVGKYGIPEISKEKAENLPESWASFAAARAGKSPARVGIHFFLDDYRFRAVWNQPDRYIDLLRRFPAVLQPDFSLYTDMPRAMQIYNHYRKQWLAAYWQLCGLRVIPTICWSDQASYEWCFDGVPAGGCVAVSSVGTQKGKAEKQGFLDGYYAMLERLAPEAVLFYGKIPKDIPQSGIISIGETFYNKFDQAKEERKKWADAEQSEEKAAETGAEGSQA